MCDKAVRMELYVLEFVPDWLKTREMCERNVERYPGTLKFVPDHLKTQGTCERAVEDEPYSLKHVPDHLKARGMCNKVVGACPWTLELVPDWFVAQQQIRLWRDSGHGNDEDFIRWYNGYQKRKAQKAKIKKELMPITWHPSRWWDWCVPEDEKKETEKFFSYHLIC